MLLLLLLCVADDFVDGGAFDTTNEGDEATKGVAVVVLEGGLAVGGGTVDRGF